MLKKLRIMQSPDARILDALQKHIQACNSQAIRLVNCSPEGFYVTSEQIAQVCLMLRDEPIAYFDYLSCITGIDQGPLANKLEVIYHMYSLVHAHGLTLRVELNRQSPHVPSIAHIWQGANWYEREAYDLLGIHFDNHPKLQRILLPDDWVGHPLRKDYVPEATYQTIQIDY